MVSISLINSYAVRREVTTIDVERFLSDKLIRTGCCEIKSAKRGNKTCVITLTT